MRIRAAQIELLCNAAQRDFEQRATKYLVRQYPQYAEQIGVQRLQQLVLDSQTQATAAELGSEKGIVTWAELHINYGPEFSVQQDWAHYIIRISELSSEDRLERLREYL